MPYTNAQKAILKANIIANTDPIVIAALSDGSQAVLAEWYSAISSPTFTVWRSTVVATELLNSITFSGAGGFISRTAGERDAFMMLLARNFIEPWRANVRQAFGDIFSGSGAGAPETRTALLAVSKRVATNIERVLASGTGTDASPATMTYEGALYYMDVYDILNYPG